VQLDPVKPTLKAPGTKHLKLKCDEPPSNFAFNFNLRRYIEELRNKLSSGGDEISDDLIQVGFRFRVRV